MPNGNGAVRLHTGGKDIKVPRYTLKKYIESTRQYVEWDITCRSDEVQGICDEYKAERVLKFPGIVSQQGSLLSKTDDGWKDNLKRIKQNSGKGNTIKI